LTILTLREANQSIIERLAAQQAERFHWIFSYCAILLGAVASTLSAARSFHSSPPSQTAGWFLFSSLLKGVASAVITTTQTIDFEGRTELQQREIIITWISLALLSCAAAEMILGLVCWHVNRDTATLRGIVMVVQGSALILLMTGIIFSLWKAVSGLEDLVSKIVDLL
jgi:hypothetical protein